MPETGNEQRARKPRRKLYDCPTKMLQVEVEEATWQELKALQKTLGYPTLAKLVRVGLQDWLSLAWATLAQDGSGVPVPRL
jgi:hypothetical protein